MADGISGAGKPMGSDYACQREDRFGRLQRRAAMLNRQLGGDGWAGWDSPPIKPKWMRWRTYERRYNAGSERSRKPTKSLRYAPRAC
jgi:hypothetical protein